MTPSQALHSASFRLVAQNAMATRLVEMGVEEALVGKILHHSPSTVTGRVYVRTADRFEGMQIALASWNERMSQLLSSGQ